jgi:hypothetical protein
MSGTAIWVVGEPGVGKTTVVRTAWREEEKILITKPKWTVNKDRSWCAAGHYTGAAFDGADTVPYTGAMDALVLWESYLAPNARLTIFDGDRFSNGNCRDFVKLRGWQCVCLLIEDEAGAAQRRVSRGTKQNETWIKGRRTKARRFFETFPEESRRCTGPADALAAFVELAVEVG